jgi:flagellin-like protein
MKILRRKDQEAVSPVIAIILMVAITVVLASVLYVWVMNLADTGEEAAKFPTIEVTLVDKISSGDSLTIKHTAGDPLDWKKFKIIITNNSDTSDTATMNNLAPNPDTITAGESSTFTSTTDGFYDNSIAGPSTPVSGNGIDYDKTKSYQIEVYNIKENKQVWQKKNVICE